MLAVVSIKFPFSFTAGTTYIGIQGRDDGFRARTRSTRIQYNLCRVEPINMGRRPYEELAGEKLEEEHGGSSPRA
jgi:hypothetical protein